MSTRRALLHKSKGVTEVKDVPLPKLEDDYIIVRPKAFALNPTDWKALDWRPSPGAIAGCDYSGVVEEVGKAVTKSFKVGDRVSGFARGGDPNKVNGAFAEVITAKGNLQIKIADNLSFEDAATFGVGITTVGQGLYQSLGVPLPPNKVEKPTAVLIYGGSTATGTLAIQYAKLSGLKVITTASPHNFNLVKRLGADEVFNYKDPDCAAKIREATNNDLRLAFDTISDKTSHTISQAALSSKGGPEPVLYTGFPSAQDLPARDGVKQTFRIGYTALGEWFSDEYPASQTDYDFAMKFWNLSEGLINSGKIRAHPKEVRSGGIDAIPQGLQDLKDGKLSGVKLVYKIE